MENKKYLPLKIIHLIFLVVAAVLCCMSLTKIGTDTSVFPDTTLRTVTYVAEIVALFLGGLYLLFGYKKNAAVYYKAFMVILVIAQAIVCYRQTVSTISILPSAVILNIISLIMLVVLATGKDLGKARSYLIVTILLVCRLTILTLDIIYFRGATNTGFSVFSYAVSNVLLAGTAAFMVTGKYLDKAARGTK